MTTPKRRTWRDVRAHIHAGILSGRFAPGTRLPRDADLARDLNCARATVQRAMQDLSEAGLIDRRRRGGTTVRPERITRATLEIPIVRREIDESGGRYGYRLLHQSSQTPPRTIRSVFASDNVAQMLHVEALHLSDDRPYLLEDRWINLAAVPDIAMIDLAQTSANEWLVLNQRYSHGELHCSAEIANTETAALLNVSEGAALFVMERTTWLNDALVTHVRATAAPGYRMKARL